MPYTAPYTRRKTWSDFPSTTSPILAADLTAFEDLLTAAMIGDETQGGTVGAPTSRTVWKFQPKDTNKGPFQMVIGGASFNTTWDTVMYLGYNCTDGGGRALGSEPAYWFGLEQDYNDGTKHVIENYVNYTNSAGTFTRRPWMIQVNRATDANPQWELQGTTFTFSDWTTATAFATWSKAGLTLLGATGTPTTLAINTVATQTSAIITQYNAATSLTVSSDSTGTSFSQGGTLELQFFTNNRVSWFAQDNTTARMTVVGDTVAIPTLAVKADAAQADSLFAAVNSSAAKLSHFNKGGYFMTRLHAAPADADVATGELAIWFDQTAGAAKAMFKAKNASGTVVTASVAMA